MKQIRKHRLCRRSPRNAARALATLMLAGAPFIAAPAWAMYPKVEFDEMVHTSNIVFLGQVESLVSRRSDTGNAIVTDVTSPSSSL